MERGAKAMSVSTQPGPCPVPKLSVVSTLFKSSEYIRGFCERAKGAAGDLVGGNYEIILVNDGSPDDSLEVAAALAESDPNVTVIDLSRNFGHHRAMMTGLAHAGGDLIFLIDSDLEEDPAWLSGFVAQMQVDGSDVVFGVQKKRKGGAIERTSGWLFYRLFRALTGIEQPDNIVTARVMTRRYVQALVSHQERELNIGGLWVSTGFKQSRRSVDKLANSPTTYTFGRKFSHLVNAVTSFSSMPLVLIFYAGLLISGSAAMFIAYLLFRYFFVSAPPDGYTSVLASIWFFSGLIILFMGVQGIYLSKVFSEVKQRPYTIIRQVYGGAACRSDK